MGLRSTYRYENRIEFQAFMIELTWNGEGRAYSGSVEAADEFGLGCVFEPICVAPTIPLGRLVARGGVWCLWARILPLPRREVSMADKVAGIDVHKKVLMVVVIDASTPESKPERAAVRNYAEWAAPPFNVD
jgi:hypothetical protein